MKIEIIGRGNVASHLAKALSTKATVATVNPHTLEGLNLQADLYILSVSDSAIREVAEKLASILGKNMAPVVHTSGTTGLDALKAINGRRGVFYPLQTFSKDFDLDYSEIPIFVEGSDPYTTDLLKETAELMTKHVYEADSDKRRSLHIASVMSCNFVNHLYALSKQYLESHDLPFEALHPLIRETVRKACSNDPAKVQTGPAARRDMLTINNHLSMLKDDENLKEIYEVLTNSILNVYEWHII